jgi:hypothetical protein
MPIFVSISMDTSLEDVRLKRYEKFKKLCFTHEGILGRYEINWAAVAFFSSSPPERLLIKDGIKVIGGHK